jgi:hypothetical protein
LTILKNIEIHKKNYTGKFFRNEIVVVERIRRSGVFVIDRWCVKGADWAPSFLKKKTKEWLYVFKIIYFMQTIEHDEEEESTELLEFFLF